MEDYYDSEFRFSGQPFPSLQGLEPDAPVIYMGTFSKTLYPALRIGYLVVPKALVSSRDTTWIIFAACGSSTASGASFSAT
nr:DNA-binding protein [Candidatus Pantoea persica]